jgi:aspartate/methionine/tyrosine aminotransferase
MTDKLLKPFSAHNINMEVFFQDVAEKVKQREKEIEEKRKRELEERRQREAEEMRKREIEE